MPLAPSVRLGRSRNPSEWADISGGRGSRSNGLLRRHAVAGVPRRDLEAGASVPVRPSGNPASSWGWLRYRAMPTCRGPFRG